MSERSDVLRSIRADRGFSADDVSNAIGVKATRLLAFEAGERQPSPRQLSLLAKAYGVYTYQLQSGRRPNLPPLPRDFRRSNTPTAKLTIDGYRAYLFGEQLAAFSESIEKELSSGLKLTPITISPSKSPAEMAENFRRTIGFDEAKFLDLRSPAKAARYIRANVERAGVSVVTSWYNHEDFRGYYYKYFETHPLIMIHSKGWDVKSRLFTFAHEVGHWLLGQEGISDPFITQNSVERYCNEFAASLLGTPAAVQSAVTHTSTSRRDVTAFVRNVASKLLLSQYATAIRLRELSVFTSAQFAEWMSGRISAGDPKGGFGTSGEGEPPGTGQRILPRYGFLTALSVQAARRSHIADPLEIHQATGIAVENQSELVEEAEAQLDELGLK